MRLELSSVSKMQSVISLIHALVVAACVAQPIRDRTLTGRTTVRCPSIFLVSMLDLLNRPDEYEGECVLVRGYYEYGMLFLTREHAMIGLFELSLDIVAENDDPGEIQLACPAQYVTVVGRLSKLPAAGRQAAQWVLNELEEVSWFDQGDEENYPLSRVCWSRPLS